MHSRSRQLILLAAAFFMPLLVMAQQTPSPAPSFSEAAKKGLHCLYPNNNHSPMSPGLKETLFSLGRPQIEGLREANFNYGPTDIREIYYQGYVSFFNTKTKTALMTIHRLDKENRSPAKPKRSKSFFAEKRLRLTEQVTHEDYVDDSKVLSRGHFTPSSWANNNKFRKDTFSTANIAPQVQKSFNDGLWNKLEICSRIWRDGGMKLNVITGVLFQYPGKSNVPKMTYSNVRIPSHFYKIFVREDKAGKGHNVLSFLMENRDYKDSEQSLDRYISSYQTIEKLAGIKFFPGQTSATAVLQDDSLWPGCEAFILKP